MGNGQRAPCVCVLFCLFLFSMQYSFKFEHKHMDLLQSCVGSSYGLSLHSVFGMGNPGGLQTAKSMYHNTLLNHPDKLLTHWAHNKFQWVRKCGLTSALPSTYVHSLGVKVTSVKNMSANDCWLCEDMFFFYFTYKILRKLTCHRTHTRFTFALHMLLFKKKKKRKTPTLFLLQAPFTSCQQFHTYSNIYPWIDQQHASSPPQ